MAESLEDLLSTDLDISSPSSRAAVATYLQSLQSRSLDDISRAESESLAQASHKTLLALQKLSTRSHSAIITSSDCCDAFTSSLPELGSDLGTLRDAIPRLDHEIVQFSQNYSKKSDTEVLDRRKNAMLLLRNVDKLSDILDLPSLLQSTIQTSSGSMSQGGSAQGLNYASALDLHTHTKRLHALYPDSTLVAGVADQSEQAMQAMTSNLINGIKSSNVKLAGGIRTIGWLKRIAPELDASRNARAIGSREGGFGALFLVCRLANLLSMLEALDPLRELAETELSQKNQGNAQKESLRGSGQQTEKYLKRYIEVFREQSFAIISMYRSIFPSGTPDTASHIEGQKLSTAKGGHVHGVPSPLATFPSHLVGLLTETLTKFLPNIKDKTSRESLLTQVLYCAGSLGRLGGDFSMLLALLEEDLRGPEAEESEDWVGVVRKHRVLASRLELLANGVGANKSPSRESTVIA